MRKLILNILLYILKEEETMYLIYASLIIKGKKKFYEVPKTLKEQVRQALIDLECEHLIIESPEEDV